MFWKRCIYAQLVTACIMTCRSDAFVTPRLSLSTCVSQPPYALQISRSCVRLNVSPVNVVERLELSDNFNRWRFMQKLLDAEIESSDVNEVLYRVLASFVKHSQSAKGESNEMVSPLATEETLEIVKHLLQRQNTESQIAAFTDPDCNPGDETILLDLQKLLPDPRENEEASKGAWETVMELHGRESVKINESKGTPQWKALCLVARVLIYFDFLSTGVMP